MHLQRLDCVRTAPPVFEAFIGACIVFLVVGNVFVWPGGGGVERNVHVIRPCHPPPPTPHHVLSPRPTMSPCLYVLMPLPYHSYAFHATGSTVQVLTHKR